MLLLPLDLAVDGLPLAALRMKFECGALSDFALDQKPHPSKADVNDLYFGLFVVAQPGVQVARYAQSASTVGEIPLLDPRQAFHVI